MKLFKRSKSVEPFLLKSDNKIKVSKQITDKINESFQESIKSVLIVAQFSALMPVVNVTSKEFSDLTFKWSSFRAIFTYVHITLGSIIALVFLRFISGLGINAGNVGEDLSEKFD